MSKYTILDKIGRGRFGIVFKVIHNENNKHYVLKYINSKHSIDAQYEIDTLKILKREKLPYIVNLVEEYITHNLSILLVFDYIHCVDLHTFIHSNTISTSSSIKISIIKDMIRGLHLIHSMNLVHLDIKPHNILIDGLYSIKYIDFGNACEDDHHQRYRRYCGTIQYMDPHMIERNINSFEDAQHADIWSLGVTIYNLVHGELPWKQRNKNRMKKEISSTRRIYSEHTRFSDMINNMLWKDRNKRYSLERLLNLV